MNLRMRSAGAVLGLCVALMAGAASDLVGIPPLQARVIDLTQTLEPAQQARLEAQLRDFEVRKGSQIAVLILPTTQPETIEQFSIRLAGQWKLGRKKVDDGAILVVAKTDRVVRIEVGYGLEGALNDATAKRIISETITPLFKAGQFAEGIAAGVDQMLKVIDGEPLPPPAASRRAGGNAGLADLWPLGLLLVVVVGGVLRALVGRLPAALVIGGLVAVLAWVLAGAVLVSVIGAVMGFALTLAGGGVGRSVLWAGGRGRGGFDGGGGGGGFGGGGGGFGGGGASGRW